MKFCVNCGQPLQEGNKYCSNCGTKIADNHSEIPKRNIVYEGEIHKCPHCGEILSAFAVTCPSCGYDIRNRKTSKSIKEFANCLSNAKDDITRITLIQSFPIPNNKDDILEFMILAFSCFDVNDNLSGNGIKKQISDAWFSKIEQGYQKSKLLFSNDSDFTKIQNIYEQSNNIMKTMSDTIYKEKLRQLFLSTIGLWGGLFVLLIGVFIYIVSPSTNTSIFHISGGLMMIIGAFTINHHKKDMMDIVIGSVTGILALLFGMLFEEVFSGNGSAMILSGGLTMIIVVIQLVRKQNKK